MTERKRRVAFGRQLRMKIVTLMGRYAVAMKKEVGCFMEGEELYPIKQATGENAMSGGRRKTSEGDSRGRRSFYQYACSPKPLSDHDTDPDKFFPQILVGHVSAIKAAQNIKPLRVRLHIKHSVVYCYSC